MTGYVKLWRGWRDNPVLRDPERALAWLWLIENAAWKPGRIWIKGQSVDLNRGEMSFSVRFLADQWGWSKSAVDRFLGVLRREGMIQTRSKTGTHNDHNAGQGQSILTICNYVKYQSSEDGDRDNSGTTTGTTAGQQRDKEEESKKERIEESVGDGAQARADTASGIDPNEGWDPESQTLHGLANQCAVVGGVRLDFKNLPKALDQVKAWMAFGADTELILSTIRSVVTKTDQQQINSLRFFDGAIRKAVAQQEATRNGHRADSSTSGEPTFGQLAMARLAELEQGGSASLGFGGDGEPRKLGFGQG